MNENIFGIAGVLLLVVVATRASSAPSRLGKDGAPTCTHEDVLCHEANE